MHDPGYSITEHVLSAAECAYLIADLCSSAQPRSRAGARHLMTHPRVATLANDNRLIRIAKQSLGATAIPFRATLFEKSPANNWLVVWHQDTALPLVSPFESPEWGPWSIKAGIHYAHAPAWALNRVVALRLHLDPCTADNGPLRVIPGSHRHGLLTDDQVFAHARASDPVECLVPAGGVLAMRPLLIHSSSKGTSAEPRRVLHIEYADSLDLTPGIQIAIA